MTIKYCYSLLFLFVSFYLSGQNLYQKKLDSFVNEKKQEKVYIHFDKPQYSAGEDIWFKAYVTNAVSHQPSLISKTLHVELIDKNKNIVDSLTLFIKNSVTHGSFSLKQDSDPGRYLIRAYTEWMRNYDDAFFYEKELIVINTLFDKDLENIENVSTNEKRPIIDFLPEGGDLIDGVPAKVAIKTTNKYENSIRLNGRIINQKGEELAKFKSNELGHSLFYMKNPTFGEKYFAITGKDTFNLPQVVKAGASIRVINNFKSDDVHIAVLSKNVDLEGGTLVIHNRGKFLFSAKCLNKTSFAIRLKKTQLKTGIIHLTFFDKNRIPLSERLVFPNPPIDKSKVEVSSDKKLYKKRSKVKLLLSSVKDTIHSASLTINPQTESSYKKYDENIENYLLLSSDLKGKIESPGFYFTGTEKAFNALDLLMLTQGWSRFNWTSLLDSDDYSPEYLPEDGLKISGEITNYYNGEVLKDALLGITIPSVGILNETYSVNEDGTFHIVGLRLMDSTNIYIRALKRKRDKIKTYKSAEITLNHPVRPEILYTPHKEIDVNHAFLDKAKELRQISEAYFLDGRVTELDEVVVTAKSFKQEEMDKRTRYSDPNNRLILDSLDVEAMNPSIFILLSRIPGVRITGSFPNQSVVIIGGASSVNSGPATFYLDGSPVDIATIQYIPIQSIEFIDVLRGPRALVLGASRGSSGGILIYTRRGSSFTTREQRPEGLLAFTHPGYHKAKEFYSPSYDVVKEEHIIPDFRTTLHWEPELNFKDGLAEIEFYTSDQADTFLIRFEGLSTSGEPFFEESFIQVE